MKKLITLIAALLIVTSNASAITLSTEGTYQGTDRQGYSLVVIQGELYGVDNPYDLNLKINDSVTIEFNLKGNKIEDSKIIERKN
jgi:hypothetical protein